MLRPIVSEKDHIQGSNDAPIVLVEYGDYQCPHCGRAYPIVKRMQEKLGDQLKFVFRNFPLAKIHPEATMAAVATEAAALQDKYWEMHDIIFENQDKLGADTITQLAETIDLDLERFHDNMKRKDLISKVEMDFESGIKSGVNRTPTFFINGEKYEGMFAGDQLLNYLRSRLAEIIIS